MRKNVIAAIAGAMVLCMAAAGCASTQTGTVAAPGTADTAATAAAAASEAATESVAAAATEAMEAWYDKDEAYLSGIKAKELVELPKSYRHLEVETAKPEEVTDKDVDEDIENTLRANAPLEEVDRKVKEGDTVNIDYVGKLDGVEFDGGSGSYDLVIGSHSFIEGFEEGLIGAEKGDTLDLNLTFPEKYHAPNLAGKEVVFTVTVNKISEYKVPELNDDYVRSLNKIDKFNNAITSVDDYKEYVKANLEEKRESTYRQTVIAACLNKLLVESTFKGEIPAAMKDQYNDSMTRMLQYYALMNYMELKDLMINAYQATEDNYMDMIGDFADSQMKRDIILQAIADEKDLNPDEEEIEKAVTDYVESEETVQSVDQVGRYAREFLRDELMRNKVYNWLVDHANVEEPSEEKDDAAEAETSSEGMTDAAAADTSDTAAEASSTDTTDDAGEKTENAEAGETGEDNSGEDASKE